MKNLCLTAALFASIPSFAATITVFPLGANPNCPVGISSSLEKMASELTCPQKFEGQKLTVYLGCGSADAHNYAKIEIYNDNTTVLLATSSNRTLKIFATPQEISKKILTQSLCE